MVIVKAGVKFRRFTPAILRILAAGDQVSRDLGVDLVVTSTHEKAKGRLVSSKHYTDEALDFRISNLTPAQVKAQRALLADYLGGAFDVVSKEDHTHVEFDPV